MFFFIKMKVRFKGNSIRLRLTQTEVNRLAAGISVVELTVFSVYHTLKVELQPWLLEATEVWLDKAIILLRQPESAIKIWAESEQISMASTVDNGQPNGLLVLIEKDFECLTERKEEDKSDQFPNPAQGTKC